MVGGRKYDQRSGRRLGETIHLRQQRVQGSLFGPSSARRAGACLANGIDLVDKDDARRVPPRPREEVTDVLWTAPLS